MEDLGHDNDLDLDFNLDIEQYDLDDHQENENNDEDEFELDGEEVDDDEVLSDLSDIFEQDAHLLQLAVDTRELALDDVPFDRDLKYINVAGGSGQVDEKAMRRVRKLVLTDGDETKERRRRDHNRPPRKENNDAANRRRRGYGVEIDEDTKPSYNRANTASGEGRGKKGMDSDKLWRPKLMTRPISASMEKNNGSIAQPEVDNASNQGDNSSTYSKEATRESSTSRYRSKDRKTTVQKLSQLRPSKGSKDSSYSYRGQRDTDVDYSGTGAGEYESQHGSFPRTSHANNRMYYTNKGTVEGLVESSEGIEAQHHTAAVDSRYEGSSAGGRGHGGRSHHRGGRAAVVSEGRGGRGRGSGRNSTHQSRESRSSHRHRRDEFLVDDPPESSSDVVDDSSSNYQSVYPYSTNSYNKRGGRHANSSHRSGASAHDSRTHYQARYAKSAAVAAADGNIMNHDTHPSESVNEYHYVDPNQQLRVTAPEFTPFSTQQSYSSNTNTKLNPQPKEFVPSVYSHSNASASSEVSLELRPQAPEFVPSFARHNNTAATNVTLC